VVVIDSQVRIHGCSIVAHLAHDRKFMILQEADRTLPIFVGLPNGTNIAATHQGSVTLRWPMNY